MIKRADYIDVGAGIMILWMITFHALLSTYRLDSFAISELSLNITTLKNGWGVYLPKSPVVLFPYLHFFMPWFFYKSGQFFSKRDSYSLLVKDWKKLLTPFLLWSFVGYVFFVVFCCMDGSFSIRKVTLDVLSTLFFDGHVSINGPLWFLLTLFLVRQVANVILPSTNDKYYWPKIISIVLIGSCAAYAFWHWKIKNLPLWIINGTTGFVFYALGYSMHKYETKWWLIVPCAMCYIVCCVWGFSVVGMRTNVLLTPNKLYILNIPECFAGIVVFNVCCRIAVEYCHKYLHWLLAPLKVVGSYAMVIYVTHALLYKSVVNITMIYKLGAVIPYTLWIILGLYIVFLPLFCYVSRLITFQKQPSAPCNE